MEIAGLPVNVVTTVDTVSPYAAIAVIKGIDSDGDDVYAFLMTDGMTDVDAAGLVQYAKAFIDNSLRSYFDKN
jgi:hypothetical protein